MCSAVDLKPGDQVRLRLGDEVREVFDAFPLADGRVGVKVLNGRRVEMHYVGQGFAVEVVNR